MSAALPIRTGLVPAVLVLLTTAPARAWTESDVRTATALVEARPDGRARVTLELDVRVRRGWLEGLEVAGLHPDLTLDPERPGWWTAMDGEVERTFEPTVRKRSDGRLQFRFPRRKAPRRGTYRAGLAFRSPLAVDRRPDDRVRLGWTLPAWRWGLDDVRITMVAPEGATAATDLPETPSRVRVTRERTADGQTRITFRRAHLPRTLPWTVAVEVPADAMAPGLLPEADAPTPPPAASTDGGEPAPAGDPGPAPWALAAVLALVAIGKIGLFARAAGRRGIGARPLLPVATPARAVACLAVAAGGALLWSRSPVGGLALLSALPLLVLERVPKHVAPPRLGAFRRAARTDLARARRSTWGHRLLGPALLDLGSIPGAVVLAGCAAAVVALDPTPAPGGPISPAHALALLVPLGLIAGPRTLPLPAAVRLHRLAGLAARLRLGLGSGVPVAFELALHEDRDGVWQDARLRCVLPRSPSGLLRLDVVMADRPRRGELVPEPALVTVARAGSMADALLEGDAEGDPIEAPGGRVARIVELRAGAGTGIARTASALAGWSDGGAGTDDETGDETGDDALSVRAVA